LALVLAMAGAANAAIVTCVNSAPNQYDIILQMQAGDGDYLGHGIDASANLLADPNQPVAEGGVAQAAGDTWVNTVGSSLGMGPATITYNVYNPGGFSPDAQPMPRLWWDVFDTLQGDNVGNVPGPVILVRLMTTPGAVGTADLTLGMDAGTTQHHFDIPEPATMSLLALGGLALIRRRR
jgi:hypothetical protein